MSEKKPVKITIQADAADAEVVAAALLANFRQMAVPTIAAANPPEALRPIQTLSGDEMTLGHRLTEAAKEFVYVAISVNPTPTTVIQRDGQWLHGADAEAEADRLRAAAMVKLHGDAPAEPTEPGTAKFDRE